MGGGGSSPSQAIVQTGPTVGAANAAAAAQINSANLASQIAQQNTNKALNSLMKQYGTALQYAQPAINTGNQAMAQMNYLMGLPAVNPGPAPDVVNLQSELAKLTPDDINTYINSHTNLVGASGGEHENPNKDASNWLHPSYTGVGADDPNLRAQYLNAWNAAKAAGGTNSDYVGGAGLTSTQNVKTQSGVTGADIFGTDSTLKSDISNYLANQNLQNDLPAYQNTLNAYNNQANTYNSYNARGPASAADINNVVNNMPGFQFQQQQGIGGIENSGSASGLLNSGALLQQLDKFGQGLASTYYNNYLNQLGGLANAGNAASSQVGQGSQVVGNNLAGLYSNLGDNMGNAALTAGQAQASSFLSPLSAQETRVTNIGGGGGGGGFGDILGGALGLLGGGGSGGGGFSGLLSGLSSLF